MLQLTPNVIIIHGEDSTTSRPTAENLSNTLTRRALTSATLSMLAIVLCRFAVRPLASVTRLSRDYANQRSITVTFVTSHARQLGMSRTLSNNGRFYARDVKVV